MWSELTFCLLLCDVRLNCSLGLMSKVMAPKFTVASVAECGPTVAGDSCENWVWVILVLLLRCLSPGENQPPFLFCRIIPQQGQFSELAHPGSTSAKVEKALVSQRGGGENSTTAVVFWVSWNHCGASKSCQCISLLYFWHECYLQCSLVHSWLAASLSWCP